MSQDDRKRIVALAELMDEMDAGAVYVRTKMPESVQGIFLSSPVEAIGPVLHKRAQFVAVRSKGPTVLDLVGPPGSVQPGPEVVQDVLRHVDRKRPDVHVSVPRGVSSS